MCLWFVEEHPLSPFFSSHMLRALLVYSISYFGQDCALRHFHKTDRLDPHICCLRWNPNIYVLHVWESVWKSSAAIAGFQQNFEQNLLLDEQNSEQTKIAELGFMLSIICQSLTLVRTCHTYILKNDLKFKNLEKSISTHTTR